MLRALCEKLQNDAKHLGLEINHLEDLLVSKLHLEKKDKRKGHLLYCPCFRFWALYSYAHRVNSGRWREKEEGTDSNHPWFAEIEEDRTMTSEQLVDGHVEWTSD